MSKFPVLMQMRAGEHVRADAVWLSVLRGRVWVTHDLDPDDHFLDAGQAMRLPHGANALIGAEECAQLTLVAPPTWGERLRALARRALPRQGRRRSPWLAGPVV